MFARFRSGSRALLLATAFAAVSITAFAQGGHGGGPPGGGGGGGSMGGASGGAMGRSPFGTSSTGDTNNPRTNPPPPGSSGDATSTMRGGLQLGPPGRWWDDKKFAKSLGLDSGQQHRMDDVFNASKPALVKLYKSLQHEESQLEKLTRGRNPDEAQIFTQIDHVTQARGDLEKASAHYLLAIRKEMTEEQIGRLDDHRPAD